MHGLGNTLALCSPHWPLNTTLNSWFLASFPGLPVQTKRVSLGTRLVDSHFHKAHVNLYCDTSKGSPRSTVVHDTYFSHSYKFLVFHTITVTWWNDTMGFGFSKDWWSFWHIIHINSPFMVLEIRSKTSKNAHLHLIVWNTVYDLHSGVGGGNTDDIHSSRVCG